MKLYTGIMVFASVSNAVAEIQSRVNHDNLQRHSHLAYHEVENSCASDVQSLCLPKEESYFTFYFSGDPFLEWMLAPTTSFSPVPPEVKELDLFVDRMFNSILTSSISDELSSTVSFHEMSSPALVDVGVARLAAERGAEEIPQLVNQLQAYGSILMDASEAGSEHHQMARRLTEMDSKTINYHVQLPFGRNNCCLKKAFEQKKVSEKCAISIGMLERTFALEAEFSRTHKEFVRSANSILLNYTLFVFLALLVTKRVHSSRLLRRRLKRKIINAVYGNSAIRKQVELDIGQSIEHVALSQRSNCEKRNTLNQDKDLKPAKHIVYEGVPFQVV